MPIKVSQLAKDLKISSSALKTYLSNMGINVKSHFSLIDDEQVENVKKKYAEDLNQVKVIRRDSRKFHRPSYNRPKEKVFSKSGKNEKPEDIKKWTTSGRIKKTLSSTPKFNNKPFPNKPSNQKNRKVSFTPAIEIPDINPKFFKNKRKNESKTTKTDRHTKASLKQYKEQKSNRSFLDDSNIKYNIKRVINKKDKKKKYKKEEQKLDQGTRKIEINEFTSVSELANLMDIPATEIIGKFFKMGQLITINQRLDKDTIQLICDEYNMDIQTKNEYGMDIIENYHKDLDNVEKIERPPIVTIMGHVDHGKTSILDYIRKENVVAGEAGGITQHIGAYQIEFEKHKITFLDTPGHEAFAAMRSRGANATDIAVIVVAANDGIKPTTIEAIDHAKAAGVSIIVVINKIDLPHVDIDKVKGEIAGQNLLLEGFGGDVVCVECSAKTGEGINNLLHSILLVAEMSELKAKTKVPAKGIVIESSMDSQLGSIATILLQEGTLLKGNYIVCGATYGKIRRMEDERAKEIEKLYPSDVALVFGLKSVTTAGDIFYQMENEKLAIKIAKERQIIRRQRSLFKSHVSFDNLFNKITQENLQKLNLIVKADTDGSVEAICDSFEKLSNKEINVQIIHKAVGGINEADIFLASSSDAIIIGFNVRTNNKAKLLAEKEGVQIKIYQIIYDAIKDLKTSLHGMLSPIFEEIVIGTARIKEVFRVKNVGSIAGCVVNSGIVQNDSFIKLYRDNISIFSGEIETLKHYKNDIKEIKAGSECGIKIKNFNDIKPEDVIEILKKKEIERNL